MPFDRHLIFSRHQRCYTLKSRNERVVGEKENSLRHKVLRLLPNGYETIEKERRRSNADAAVKAAMQDRRRKYKRVIPVIAAIKDYTRMRRMPKREIPIATATVEPGWTAQSIRANDAEYRLQQCALVRHHKLQGEHHRHQQFRENFLEDEFGSCL